jgi:hypothetical protein
VVRARSRSRDRNLVTIPAQGPDRFGQQGGYLRGVNQMTGLAVSGLEGYVLVQSFGRLEQTVVAFSAELGSRGLDEILVPSVGVVTGDARTLRNRLMENGQTRAGADLAMTLAAKVPLGRGQHGPPTCAVGIVTLQTPFAGRQVHDFGAAFVRILVAFDAEVSRLGPQ